jgi:hypothetical protein
VVIGFVQLYKPMAETSSVAHTPRAASARAASAVVAIAGAASAGAVIVGAASAGAASAGPASKQNPTQLKAAYSPCWRNFRRWCALQSSYRRSATMLFTTSSHMGRPLLPNFGLDGEKLAAAKAEFKQLEEEDII